MKALIANWGGDLQISSTGDIRAVSVEVELQFRLLRRFLTNSGDYIWHVSYGAGLGEFVGSPLLPSVIKEIILTQVGHEPLVAGSPQPVVNIDRQNEGDTDSRYVTVQYQTKTAQAVAPITFPLGKF